MAAAPAAIKAEQFANINPRLSQSLVENRPVGSPDRKPPNPTPKGTDTVMKRFIPQMRRLRARCSRWRWTRRHGDCLNRCRSSRLPAGRRRLRRDGHPRRRGVDGRHDPEISSKTADRASPSTSRLMAGSAQEDVKVNGKTVIAKGALQGRGLELEEERPHGQGRPAEHTILSTESVDGQKVKLRASKGRKATTRQARPSTLVVLYGPLGFLKKGKDAKIKGGTRIKSLHRRGEEGRRQGVTDAG